MQSLTNAFLGQRFKTSVLPAQQVSLVMGYPEVDVFGGDLATSLDFIGGLGLWAEAAAYSHDALDLSLNFGSERIERLVDGRWALAETVLVVLAAAALAREPMTGP